MRVAPGAGRAIAGIIPPDTSSCTDGDKDGYSAFDPIACPTGTDCNDADASVHPAAAEVCNDGKDNNCNMQIDCAEASCASNAACTQCTDADQDGAYAFDATTCPNGNGPCATRSPGATHC